MKQIFLSLLLMPALVWGDVWRPSHFEIAGWLTTVPSSDVRDNVFSPIGFGISVAMLGEGTGGEHRANISEALGLLSDFGIAFSYMFKSYAQLNASNQVSITFAPSLWARQLRKLDIDYRHNLNQYFEAEAGTLANALSINAWTEAKTDGRIPKLINAVNPHTDILLANAIAFEGAWAKGFDKDRTVDSPFTRDDGTIIKVPMMHGEQPISFITNEYAHVAYVPFAAGGVSMLLFLPPNGQKLANFRSELFQKLSIDEVKTIFRTGSGESLKSETVRLALPRMEIASRWDLVSALSAFKVPHTGYSRIGPEFKINEVVQVDYIKIVETGYSLTPGVLPPPVKKEKRRIWQEDEDAPKALPKTTFAFNRPFLYFVWDENSDTLLLAGQFTGHR